MNHFGRYLVLAGLAASPWFYGACGKTTGSKDEPRSGRSGICESICKRADECGLESVDKCVRACENDDVSSSAALRVVEICAEDVTCSGFANGDLAECVVEGIADLAASSAVEEYCDDLRDWAQDCLDAVPSAGECYAVANAASSRYLLELGDCLEEDCLETTDCVESVQSRYNAGDSIIQLVATGFGERPNSACCSSGDLCDWADNGKCDCDGAYSWDADDCSEPTECPYTDDGECDEPDLCPVGTDSVDCSAQDCCVAGDPCAWADDGICDCSGTYSWDANDCTPECPYTNDGECDEPNLCPVGTDTADCAVQNCCAAGDPCGWANDNVCDCNGTYAWDANDCGTQNCCAAGDPCGWANDGECDCNGTYSWDANDCGAQNCCAAGDPCGWADDDFCDCNGTYAWDANDCSTGCAWTNDGECDEPDLCPAGTDTADCAGIPTDTCVYANDGECDEPDYCEYGTDESDCAGACCSAGNPCEWANDNVCDCNGIFSWDAVDCGL